ncbi:hypothetical protein D8674_008819 [Pyrus ussuriensis x Pyrus communis]|uniref:RNase H type-1 domain-containing protein n=1 Tax=Pyrus ussuriensis x Pyrus communis TaxID=2448454 RepID=A0A5N5I0U5_9ROSA|nr:hypothetical protein D8674_008819 [Pyrus ussuriensis x Pyrus communis]
MLVMVDLIRWCFEEEEGNLILGLPISLAGCKDRVMWHYSGNGDIPFVRGIELPWRCRKMGNLSCVVVLLLFATRNKVYHRKGFSRPNYGVLKINYVGAWSAGGERGVFYNNAAMAKAAVIRAALMLYTEMGCDEVEIESNSQVIISMLNGGYVVDATLKCFIHDIGHLVSQLRGVRFVFVKRNANAAAHAVASYIASHGGALCWDALRPDYLIFLLKM